MTSSPYFYDFTLFAKRAHLRCQCVLSSGAAAAALRPLPPALTARTRSASQAISSPSKKIDFNFSHPPATLRESVDFQLRRGCVCQVRGSDPAELRARSELSAGRQMRNANGL